VTSLFKSLPVEVLCYLFSNLFISSSLLSTFSDEKLVESLPTTQSSTTTHQSLPSRHSATNAPNHINQTPVIMADWDSWGATPSNPPASKVSAGWDEPTSTSPPRAAPSNGHAEVRLLHCSLHRCFADAYYVGYHFLSTLSLPTQTTLLPMQTRILHLTTPDHLLSRWNRLLT
jgi:hypothetical protein